MLDAQGRLLVAHTGQGDVTFLPQMANRHGLITGATGSGKTVTLQTLAEGFSALGTPVLVTDIKGDLSGAAMPGLPSGKVAERVAALHLAERGYANRGFPVCFWDVFAESGHPLRATASEMGPLLLSRLLGLNEVQSGLVSLTFRVADESGLLLLDMKDLRQMLAHVGENRAEFSRRYGNIAPASVGAVQRALLRLEEQGAAVFFGEPALDMNDLLRTDASGRGVINILAADRLTRAPDVYATLLLWLLSELYERLPEVGDLPRPRLALFFDEAHMLFRNMPRALLEKIEQVVRLIRSRGVSVFFVTQRPTDIPESVLAQLGNRVQHALRAFTPAEQKAVRAAARAFRPNPDLDVERAILELGVGEALVSFLDAAGAPAVVQRALVLPPEGRVGPLTPDERGHILRSSALAGRYDQPYDRESAYEILTARAQREAAQREEEKTSRSASGRTSRGREPADVLADVARQATRTVTAAIGREIGKSLVRGILGGLFGKRR